MNAANSIKESNCNPWKYSACRLRLIRTSVISNWSVIDLVCDCLFWSGLRLSQIKTSGLNRSSVSLPVHNPYDHIPDRGDFSVGKTLARQYNQSFSILTSVTTYFGSLVCVGCLCFVSDLRLSKHLLIGITMALTIRTHIAWWWPWVSGDMGGPRVSKEARDHQSTLR